jgi:small-conductance mechanosensitive channel
MTTVRRRGMTWSVASILVLILQCSIARAAGDGASASTAVSSTTASAPAAIPMAEVATRAANVPDLLRPLMEHLAPRAELETIARHLHETRERVDVETVAATAILRSQPTLGVIQSQQQLWQRRQLHVSGWLTALTQRATFLQYGLNRLAELRTTWRVTREAAVASSAPAIVLADIDGALAAIDTAATALTSQRAAVLDLQSLVAQEVTRSAAVLAEFTQAQQRIMGTILTRDSPPMWSPEAWSRARGTWAGRVRELAAARWNDARRYFGDPSLGMPQHAVILALLLGVFLVARHRLRRARASARVEPLQHLMVFDRPYSAAMLVTLFHLSSPLSTVPQSLRSVAALLMLVPVLRLARPTIDARLLALVRTLVVLFVLESFREAIGGAPMLEQVVLELEAVTGMAMLVYSLTLGALQLPRRESAAAGRLGVFRGTAGLAALVLGASVAAAALGYMRLARLLASGLLGGGALALTLYALVQVALGVVALALRLWPLRLLRMVQHHRELLERRAYRVMLWLAMTGAVARLLDRAGLFQPAWSLGETLLTAKLGRGSITFSVGDVLEFVLTVWVAYLVSAFIRFVLHEDVYPRTQMKRGIAYAVSSLLNYVILTLGFVLALGAVGFDLTKVTVLAGALGVGIGFGLQGVVNNFVSGLILLFERPIHVGDVIEMGDLQGEVSRIGIRASTVRTFRGADIIVPNAQLIAERVTNWTLSDRRRRIDVPVGVDYRSAPDRVVELLEAVGRGHPEVLKDPPPMAVFTAFADSAINFELRAWTNHFERWAKIQTELAVAVHAALRAAGMTIPLPQREVRLLTGGGDGSTVPPRPPGGMPAAPGVTAS